jgi:ATP-dependent helicase/nuclease subunit A
MPGSLLASLWPAIASEFCSPEIGCPSSSVSVPVAARASLRRLPLDWQLPPPPSPPRPQRLRLSAEAGTETPEYSWVGLAARAVGTIVHAELRRLASLPALPQPGELPQRAGHYGAWLTELGVPAGHRTGAEALIVEALERTLADPRGRWLLSMEHPSAESEWRLTGAHEGRIVNVVFDRMLIDEQRQRWIIDYKTSRHEGGALAQFIEREAERYMPQLRRYAALAAALGNEAVRVALYFPLLGVFRELSL